MNEDYMEKRYNLLIITPDQMRADYLGCYGHPSIGTQNLDRLADEGVRFENCYCAAPLCAPSRISFATSTYMSEHNHRDYGATISPDVPNLVTSMKKKGYRTGMFGKNHLFTYERLHELWDELDEICLGNCDGHERYEHSFSSFTMDENHPYNITRRLTEETCEFIEKQQGNFLAWVNYQDPHPAFACPPPYDTMFDPETIDLSPSWKGYDPEKEPVRNQVWREHSEMYLCSDDDMKKAIATYMGQIRYVDDMVGQLRKTLEKTGKDKNTIILFFSDHGELLGDHGMTHKLPVFYDCLTRIPVILYHPDGVGKGRNVESLIEEVDLVPTVLEFLNVEIPPTMVGRSWCREIEKGEVCGKESILCEAGVAAPTWQKPDPDLQLKAPFAPTSFGCGAMLRKGDYKLSIYSDDRCELYDITRDPCETNNLYEKEEYRHIRDELTLLLLKRTLAVKVRDVGQVEWKYSEYPWDVRYTPLEYTK